MIDQFGLARDGTRNSRLEGPLYSCNRSSRVAIRVFETAKVEVALASIIWRSTDRDDGVDYDVTQLSLLFAFSKRIFFCRL